MSLPYLINDAKGYVSASQRIPVIARPFVSERAKKTLDLVEKFVEEDCIPADTVFAQQLNANGYDTKSRFSTHPAVLEDLKRKAKSLGLWNLFLPKAHFKEGAGFSNLEYGLMAELLGKSDIAPEACNCNAPDTGNMEVLAKYGTEAQKQKWLVPLLNGVIRSAFLMTEPQVASSDATNIELTMRKEGNNYILNGQKWWSSGAGDENCKIYIVMGKSDPSNPDKYKQQSVILVPVDTPGVTVNRVLSVIGFDHAPHGHGHITFNNVRVPAENMILRPGGGFEVVQGRLGPGRIHHAMRSIGAAERALEYLLARLNDPARKPFGQTLSSHGIQLERVARSRIEIDTARLSVLNAAITIDEMGAKAAMKEIAEVKVQVPSMMLEVLDRAMQAYGAAGVSQDTPLAAMWANGRTMRIVDGPDEVHVLQLGKNENKKGNALRQRIDKQKARAKEMLASYGLNEVDFLSLDRVYGQPKL
ncbi:acyl-CoA dehydrogenase [Leptodontidium sp. 2 PMI_412]|nr:acyl-CoA dehydrogenase [Leptodontidium sp. 2 PMI_412]